MSAQELDTESAGVYAAVLDGLYASTPESPPVVIVGDTLEANMSLSYGGRLFDKDWVGIRLETIRDFEKVSRSLRQGHAPGSLVGSAFPSFPYRIPLVSVTPSLRLALERLGFDSTDTQPEDWRRETAFWSGLSRKFPDAWGLTTLSAVGFDKNMSEALIQVRHRCGMQCGSLEGIFLRKYASGWHVVQRLKVEGFERRDTGEFRYLGADAWMLARRRKIQDSTSRAISDSILLDRVPRRIRGTIVNGTSGTPFAYAQIFVHTPDLERSKSFTRIVADSAGRYEIVNPRIGSMMLELQCPGPAYKAGTTLGAPGFFVFPAIDTTLDLVAPDIRPCWGASRIHKLHAGRLDASDVRSSLVPTGEEGAVYSAVLDLVLAITGHHRARAGLFVQTVAPCLHSKSCGTVQLPLLQSLGVLDASTVSDFKVKSAQVTALRTDFARKNNMDAITPDDLDYLYQALGRVAPGQSADHSSDQFWNAFESAYPRSEGIVSLTRAGFNESRSQALIEVTFESRGWSPHSELMLFRRSSNKWRVVRRHIELEKFSGIFVNDNACVLAAAPVADIPKVLREIEGLYRFTFVTDAGGFKAGDRTVLFVPDSVSRREFEAIKTPGRGLHSNDPFPSAYGIPRFEVLYGQWKRDESTEVGMELFSSSFPFSRYRPSFDPDGVYLPGEDIEVLDIRQGQLGGRWIQNDDSQAVAKNSAPAVRGQGHFCARKIALYRSQLLR